MLLFGNKYRKNKGAVEIGYIFTFTISAILLTTFTLIADGMITDFTRIAIQRDLKEIVREIEDAIENVQTMAIKNPYGYIVHEKSVRAKVRGYHYRIFIDNETVRVKSMSGDTFKAYLMRTDLRISIRYPSEGIASSYKSIVIIYDPTGQKRFNMVGNEIVIWRE